MIDMEIFDTRTQRSC